MRGRKSEETVSNAENRVGNYVGLVRSVARSARNEGAASGTPADENLSGGDFEIVSDAILAGMGVRPVVMSAYAV